MTSSGTMADLAAYDISAERGFLAAFDPVAVALPAQLDPVVAMAKALPELLLTDQVRPRLDQMACLDLTDFCQTGADAALRMAMVRYSFLVQAYVWGEATPPASLPKSLAVPIWQLAERLGQKPLLPYSSYVLDNWAMLDPNGPIDLSNVYMIQPFTGGQDEAWFVTVHVAIEARAGELLHHAAQLPDAVAREDHGAVTDHLSAMSKVWDEVNAIFDRMPEKCDPFVYYHRVRPWIHGWKDNPAFETQGGGLVYEGVAETGGAPQAFRGQTGSQSSIVPAMDAVFGVQHASDPMKAYLDELHYYRPPAHRRFIDDLRAASTLRTYVEGRGDGALTGLYNDCILKLAQFRTQHLEYAARYINKQAKDSDGNDTDVGTGGTPFMKYLKKHRDEAQSHTLPV